jgi:DNA-binding transcriptional ArsR family regulator
MRAGRKNGTEATVYIATGMVPDWLETEKVGRQQHHVAFDACQKTRNDSDRAVLTVLRDEDGISGGEIARRAGVPKSTAGDALNRLRDEGLVELHGGGRGAKWHANGVEDVNIAGCVDLERMADIPYNNLIRASRPFSGQVIPRQEPPVGPESRYPNWMRDVQRYARNRRIDEQIEEKLRSQR